MPIATKDKVAALSQDLRSQRRLAELLGVDPAQVTRWQKGQGIDHLNADRIDSLEHVMSMLLRMYAADAAELWLTATNGHLSNRRPIDLIRAGRAEEVLGGLRAEQAGSYA